MIRGIITTPNKFELGNNSFKVTSSLTKEDIRFYLMYWDKIVVPTNNLIHVGIPDEKHLLECGAISRPQVRHQGAFSGNTAATAIMMGQCTITQELLKDKSTDWVIHQAGDKLLLPERFSHINNVLRVTLAGALPVPNADVPINEILEFKERRSDELGALHIALDELYIDILKSPDQNLSTQKAFEQLKLDIENLNKVSFDWFKLTKKYDISAEFNLNGRDLVIAATSGGLLNGSLGLDMQLGAAIGAIVSTLKVSVKATATLNTTESKKILSYVSNASREGILK